MSTEPERFAPGAGEPDSPEPGEAGPLPGGDTAGEAGEDTEAGRDGEISELQAQLEATQKSLLRAQADFANYRRRMMAEQERWRLEAVEKFAADILPVLDNLERAVEAWQKSADADPNSFYEGVAMTLRQFHETLSRQGIEPIPAEGRPFDPRFHEAVAQEESDAVPEDHVVAELRRGYTYNQKVIRPSLVQVARAPAGGKEPRRDREAVGKAEEGNDDGESGRN